MLNTCTRIAQIAMQLNPVEVVTPTNAASEKKGFLKAYNAGFAVNPVFKYNKRVLRQASKLRKELESLKAEFEGLADKYPATCTDDPEKELAVKNIIRDRILDAIITCEMAEAILEGNDATLASLSAEKYGSPTCTMVGNAYEAAQDAGKKYGGVLDRETMKALKGMRFEAQEIMHYFERALELYGIKDWIVVMDDQATAIDVRDKNISGRPLVVIPSARKVDGAKLLGRTGKPADFGDVQAAVRFDMLQEEVKLGFHLRVAMHALCDDFFRACCLQFADLPVKVLSLLFTKRAAGKAIVFAHIITYCKFKGRCGTLHILLTRSPYFARVLRCRAYGKENMCLIYAWKCKSQKT